MEYLRTALKFNLGCYFCVLELDVELIFFTKSNRRALDTPRECRKKLISMVVRQIGANLKVPALTCYKKFAWFEPCECKNIEVLRKTLKIHVERYFCVIEQVVKLIFFTKSNRRALDTPRECRKKINFDRSKANRGKFKGSCAHVLCQICVIWALGIRSISERPWKFT